MAYKIIVDSCCDARAVPSGDIPVLSVPLVLTIDGTNYVDDGTLVPQQLITALRAARSQPSTACPSPAQYADAMSGEDDCFVVTLSANLSGSYQSAVAGMELKTGSGRVHIFNSCSASAGEANIAYYVAELIGKGLSFEEIVQQGEAYLHSMRTFFVLENLDYLIKAGRIGKLAGTVATVMQIRPVMGEDGNGNIIQLAKIRGTDKALRHMVDLIHAQDEKMKAEGRPQMPLVISQCNCPDRAQYVRQLIQEACPNITDVRILPTGGVSTFYAFDGGIVVAY